MYFDPSKTFLQLIQLLKYLQHLQLFTYSLTALEIANFTVSQL